MNEGQFRTVIIAVALGFTAVFSVVVVPPLLDDPDILGAFGAGFVNPYASGYSADVLACWLILAAWVAYEAKSKGVRYGWMCLIVGIVPGVAVGLVGYLLLRSRQLVTQSDSLAGGESRPGG